MRRWATAIATAIAITAGAIVFTAGPAAAAANPQIYGVSCYGEFLVIGNFGNVDLQMEGWRIWDQGRLHTFTFPRFTLKAGKFMRLWADGQQGGTMPWLTGWNAPVWNNTGDRAYLVRPSGAVYARRDCGDAGGP